MGLGALLLVGVAACAAGLLAFSPARCRPFRYIGLSAAALSPIAVAWLMAGHGPSERAP